MRYLRLLIFCVLLLGATFRSFAQGDVFDQRIAELKSPDAGVRVAAAEALFGVDYSRVITALVDTLEDPDPKVLAAVIEALGSSGNARAVTPLLPLIKHTDRTVRELAVKALGRIGRPRATAPLVQAMRDDPSLRGPVIEALQSLGGLEAVPALVDLLGAEDPEVANQAVYALSDIGDERAIPALLAVAIVPGHPARNSAITALAAYHESAVIELLLPALESTVRRSRDPALTAVRNLGDPRFVPRLLPLLAEERNRYNVIAALGACRDRRATEAIIPYLEQDRYARVTAEALGKIRDPRAVPALCKTLRARKPPYDHTAGLLVSALGEIGDEGAVPTLLGLIGELDSPLYGEIITALRRIGGPNVVEPLIGQVRLNGQRHKDEIVCALAAIPDPRAASFVATALANQWRPGSDTQRRQVVESLFRNPALRNDELIPLVISAGMAHARSAAAARLVETGDPRTLQALLESVRKGREVTPGIAAALAFFGAQAADALLADLQNPQVHKSTVISALGQIGDARAVTPLQAWLKDKVYYESALLALARLGDPQVPPLLLQEVKYNPEQGYSAIAGLAAMRDPDAVEPLVALLKREGSEISDDTRPAAAFALGAIGDPRAVEPLIEALQDPSSFVREAAAIALTQLPPDTRALEPLCDLLYDRTYTCPAAAVTALARYPDEQATPILLSLLARMRLEDGDRTAAALFAACRDRRNPELARALIRCWQARLPGATYGVPCIEVLGMLKDFRAVPTLLGALNDPEPQVRAAAALALCEVTGQDFGADHARWVAWWEQEHPLPPDPATPE